MNNEPQVGKFFTTPLYQEENQEFDIFNSAIIQPENPVIENNNQNCSNYQASY